MTSSPDSGLPDTISHALAAVARARPDAVAMQMKDGEGYRRQTYGELAERVERLAAALRGMELEPGGRVALLAENRPEWALAYLGIVAAGGTAVPLDVQMSAEAVASALRDSGSRLVFMSARTAAALHGVRDRLRFINMDGAEHSDQVGLDDVLAREAGRPEAAPPAPDDVASLLYTSGTTKKPKGVLVTHRNLMSNAKALVQTGLAGPEDNFLVILPLHHAYPFMVAFLVPLLLGARMTFLDSLKGPDLMQCLQETRVSMFVGVPQVFAMIRRAIHEQLARRPPPLRLAARGLLRLAGAVRAMTGVNVGRLVFAPIHRRFGGSIRLLCSGGAKLDRQVARDLTSLGFTILEGYGLTETAPVVSFNPLDRPKLGSVGVPLPNVEVRIVNPDEHGGGEIAVRGPNVMKGYDRNPDETNQAVRDGWFHTGDLGYLDRDGYLYVTGRLKELIVTSGGKNIFPEELEAEYQRSPAIAELCILSTSEEDEEDERLHAVVVPQFDHLKRQQVHDVAHQIRNEINKIAVTLPAHARVLGITTVKDPLPRTRLGKIQRHLVQEQLRAARGEPPPRLAPTQEDHALLESATGRTLLQALRPIVSKRKDIQPDDHLDFDLGLDSLKRVELLTALEHHFGSLPETLPGEVTTVRDLIDRLKDTETQEPAPGEAGSKAWSDILRSDPPQAVRERLLARPGLFDRVAADLGFALLRAGFRAGFKLEVRGLDLLPREGPCLLVSNHLSFMDPFLILAAVPRSVRMRMYSLGWEPYFRSGLRRWVGRVGHVIPVGTKTSMATSMRASAAVIRAGHYLLIFPEGQRSIDGRLLPFKKGAGMLACALEAPIVPISISGSYQAWPPDASWPRLHPIAIAFGKPITITGTMVSGWTAQGSDPHEAASALMRDAIVALGSEERQPKG